MDSPDWTLRACSSSGQLAAQYRDHSPVGLVTESMERIIVWASGISQAEYALPQQRYLGVMQHSGHGAATASSD